jgi:glycine hydroxymethyltransferase
MSDVAETLLHDVVVGGLERLHEDDPELYDILEREIDRQSGVLSLVASSSLVDPSVLASQACVAVNVTAEGYPGRRYHGGCEVVDAIEQLAIDRARSAFGARYANVQPHSATNANYTVLSSLLRPGDTFLGMELQHGGHLTHGSPAAYAGQYFNAIGYGLTGDGHIDYDQVRRLALQHRPRVIICGATAYPRVVDFARFRRIADEAGAYLMADISHTAGLVATGLHPSPIDHAHVTTTCTHKQLFGPRGGLIMSGRDADTPAPRGSGTLSAFLQRAVFPFSQGAPALNTIAAKARALELVTTAEFRLVATGIVELARTLAGALAGLGHTLVAGGTDNHIVLVDLAPLGLTGLVAERALEECGIIVNKNRVPHDTTPALVTGGIRIGTNSAARRGMRRADMFVCAGLIDRVIRSVEVHGERDYHLPAEVRDDVRARVAALCADLPIPGYPAADRSPWASAALSTPRVRSTR